MQSRTKFGFPDLAIRRKELREDENDTEVQYEAVQKLGSQSLREEDLQHLDLAFRQDTVKVIFESMHFATPNVLTLCQCIPVERAHRHNVCTRPRAKDTTPSQSALGQAASTWVGYRDR